MDAASRQVIFKKLRGTSEFSLQIPSHYFFFISKQKIRMKPAQKVKMLVKNGRNWRFYSAHWTNVTSGTNRPAGAGPFGPTGGSGGHNTHLGERALNVGGVCVQRQAPTPGGGQLKPISCWQNFARVFLHFWAQNNQLPGRTGQLLSFF